MTRMTSKMMTKQQQPRDITATVYSLRHPLGRPTSLGARASLELVASYKPNTVHTTNIRRAQGEATTMKTLPRNSCQNYARAPSSSSSSCFTQAPPPSLTFSPSSCALALEDTAAAAAAAQVAAASAATAAITS